MRRVRWAMLLIAAGLALPGGDAAAQAPFLLVPGQNLEFGQLVPGVPVAVVPTDATRRGEIRIVGQGTVTLSVALPQHLDGPGGRRIPLAFSGTDGLWNIKNKTGRFDPKLPLQLRLNPSEDEARIFFGGTAQPAAGQPAGSYTAMITVTVVQTGT